MTLTFLDRFKSYGIYIGGLCLAMEFAGRVCLKQGYPIKFLRALLRIERTVFQSFSLIIIV